MLLVSCARINPQIRRDTAFDIANSHQFQATIFKTSDFNLQAFRKIAEMGSESISVYIEGDGLAWRRKNRLSNDPTPLTPLALQLAVNDPASNVIYLARPCQFLEASELETCEPKYWSSHRYAAEVVDSFNQTLDQLKQRTGASRIKLYGYSGGGVIAYLLAANRSDIEILVSIAANLDHKAWSEHHSVSALSGSLNPLDVINNTAGIKQVHFSGEKDKIVPPHLTEAFIRQMANKNSVQQEVIADFEHQCCWVDDWPELLQGIK